MYPGSFVTLLLQWAGLPWFTRSVAAAIEGNWNNLNLMKKYISHSFWSCLSIGAFLLAALTAKAQLQYPPGNFDVEISFACNCTCFCDTNMVDTNNPISVFLAANPPTYVYATSAVAPKGQVVPPHWTEFLPLDYPPYDPQAYNLSNPGSSHPWDPEGWTETLSTLGGYTYTWYNSTVWLPVTYSPGYPLDFQFTFNFYATNLPPDNPIAHPNGILPVQPQPPMSPMTTTNEPYPQDVNVTMKLANGEYYYMEQQLVVGYYPLEDYPPTYDTPVYYQETNGLLTISLYCTNGAMTNILMVSGAQITATLLPNNIPAPLNQNVGFQSPADDLFVNWPWPLTPLDMAENPPNLGNSPGAAGTVQASLSISGSTVLSNIPLLVRADRAYEITVAYSLTNCIGGNSYYVATITNDTGLVPPCTNLAIALYTSVCSICETSTPPPNTYCWVTNIGYVDMMGTPDDPPGITMWAYGDYNTFSANLTGLALSGLPWPPVPFQLPVLLVNVNSATFEKWATESLGLNAAYEYFSSPVLYPVIENCNQINNLSNDFVMCPTNPAVVEGTITLNGCVDTNYFNGVAALSVLEFAVYSNGLPCDPINSPYTVFTSGDPIDLTLQNVTTIQATNGASASSPFNNGGGKAITEFDNPGGFSAQNNYTGQYSLKLAGLQSQPSVWSVNDLHLVFGSPVNLDYHVVETNASYTNVNISCGATVTNNIALCFGLVTIGVTNLYPSSATFLTGSLQVSGTGSDSGSGYTVGPITKNFNFTVSAGANFANVQLFLPAGNYQWTGTANTLSTSDNLDVTNYFTVTCCTNPCQLVVDCPTNKAVSCATNWTFDLPTVHTNCCGTNYSISIFGNDVTTSNGPCSTTNTRTWLITDCNGHTSFCSQTVTVAPPSSYTLTLQPGTIHLIANQLNHTGGNSANLLFPNNGSRDGEQLLFYGCATNTTYIFDSASPSGFDDSGGSPLATAPTLSPGQGVFYFNNSGSPETVTFTGTPVCPPLPVPLCPCGIETLVSYELDCLGTYEGITGFPPQQGVQVRRWNGSGYTVNTFNNGAWTLGTPVLNVGEAAFILIPCPINPTNPLPVINIGTLSGTTVAATFNLGAGNGTFTFSNNAWSESGGNYNYTLQTSTNLLSTNWITVCNAIPTIGYTFTNVGPINFYRLQLQTNQ